jgi:hypothetical protein
MVTRFIREAAKVDVEKVQRPKMAKGLYMQQLKFAGGHPPNYYAADTELK